MSPFDNIPGYEDDEPAPAATNVVPLRPQPAAGKANEQPQAAQFQPIDFAALEGREPPPREWVIEDWLPAGILTSLYGAGGIGKSMLAQQKATCLATGISAFGFRVSGPMPVVGFFAEDDDDELWRRQVRTNDAVSLQMSGLRKLHLQGRAGLENTLVRYSSSGEPQFGPLVGVVNDACERYRPRLLILDNIAQLFGGDENNRHQVAHFCNVLVRFARHFGCAVLLLGHPSKAEGSEYSGSTAWNNSVRSRLLLNHDKEGQLQLVRPKANYAPKDNSTLPLAWINGVLRPVRGGDGFSLPGEEAAQRQQEQHVEGVFLAALDKLAELKVNVSHSANAGNYAPKLMRQYGLTGELRSEALRDAMLRLIGRNEIVQNRPIFQHDNRMWAKGLARPSSVASEPEQQQAEVVEAATDAAEGAAGPTVKRDADGTWWREVERDEVHQPGVHVRMNMTTGRSEVEISEVEATAAANRQGLEEEKAGG